MIMLINSINKFTMTYKYVKVVIFPKDSGIVPFKLLYSKVLFLN